MNRKKILLAVLLCCVLLATGCGKQAANSGSSGMFAVLTDDGGRKVEIAQKPQRIVVLSTSLLETLYAAGGKAVGKPSSRSVQPIAGTENLQEIGFVYNVNVEQVMALKPDLVIGFQGIHEKIAPVFEGAKIPVLLLRIKTYDDLKRQIALCGRLSGTESEAEKTVAELDGKVSAIQAKLPQQPKKVAILHATAKSVTVEMESSVTGNIAALLKLQNIASGSTPLDSDGDMTPYSLEKLVAADPDLVLVVTMGSNFEDIEKRLRQDVQNNPAWASLRAVRENRVAFLPSELFQLNPGLKYPAAFEYLAKTVYPEVYGNVR